MERFARRQALKITPHLLVFVTRRLKNGGMPDVAERVGFEIALWTCTEVAKNGGKQPQVWHLDTAESVHMHMPLMSAFGPLRTFAAGIS